MSSIDNMYHEFFGMKPQTNEADLLNKLVDYKGGFLYKLLDPATAGNVKADIQAFLNKVKEQGKHKDVGIKFKIEHNTKEHQMKDGECGMFTMYFIISMLKKQSFKQFKKKFKGGGDQYMNHLRNVLFN